MRVIWLALVGALLATEAVAQSVSAPRFSVDDTWVYQETNENRAGWHQTRVEITVARVESASIAISEKQVGSTMPPREQLAGADWSRFRSVNGHETVVNRPLSFPSSIGKSWIVDYTEQNPNRQHSSEHFRSVYKVTGWEDVTVPAGVFHALKIEADGEWTATLAPTVGAVSGTRVDGQGSTTIVQTGRTVATTASGRMHKAFWYVPAVKRWVKSTEEYYDPNGVRNQRYMSELESYKASN